VTVYIIHPMCSIHVSTSPLLTGQVGPLPTPGLGNTFTVKSEITRFSSHFCTNLDTNHKKCTCINLANYIPNIYFFQNILSLVFTILHLMTNRAPRNGQYVYNKLLIIQVFVMIFIVVCHEQHKNIIF